METEDGLPVADGPKTTLRPGADLVRRLCESRCPSRKGPFSALVQPTAGKAARWANSRPYTHAEIKVLGLCRMAEFRDWPPLALFLVRLLREGLLRPAFGTGRGLVARGQDFYGRVREGRLGAPAQCRRQSAGCHQPARMAGVTWRGEDAASSLPRLGAASRSDWTRMPRRRLMTGRES
jgi:hypothetical protein